MKFLNSIFNWLLAVVAFFAAGFQWFYLKLTGQNLVPTCHVNTIDSDLQLDLVLDSAMTAFKQMLAPLALFATAFYDVPLKGTDIVEVPYYPLETAASKDFNGSYVFDKGTDTQSKSLTINERKYQPLSYTSAELRRQPKFDPEKLGALKGSKLAEDILVDILSVVTIANFGANAFTGAAADFDADDVIDLRTVCSVAKWPASGRGIVIDPTYIGGLSKDMVTNGGMATFERDALGEALTFPRMGGFSWAESNVIPANGESLVGFAVYQSAILVGFSPITPAPEVARNLSRYEVVSDPDTGISLEYREWGDPDTDTAKRTIEANYGFAPGEGAALKRIASA